MSAQPNGTTQGLLSTAERQAFLAALDDPMTDDEAVGLIAELVTLTAAVSKVASQAQQKALLPTMIRAGNMVPYVSGRLAAVAEVIAERNRLANIVRSHEAQILRMTSETAALKTGMQIEAHACAVLEARNDTPPHIAAWARQRISVVSAVIARAQGGEA